MRTLSVVLFIIFILLLGLSLSSCTREIIRYQQVPLYLPGKATLPTVQRGELQCLTQDVAERLETHRNLIIRDRDICRAVVCSTHPEGECPKEE